MIFQCCGIVILKLEMHSAKTYLTPRPSRPESSGVCIESEKT
jgi:hypothetical protein